ncbi:hypothetical protein IVA95_17745 [Bradyrhizobium sp. 157]|uniref:hypothetical protein n=1 Tax=Bradyrhizobium sp. 157 TaxID=2782631 RepID=UPI001FFA84BC|nr:hypothetical protein [Bradyrhizobium sp. 157]MCK1639403.1 hypothetical protein [Bradyrhizobium sp. 157]
MTYRTTFIASLSAVALVLAAGQAFADPTVARGAGVAPSRPAFPAFPKSGHHHHHHRGVSGFWPTGGVVYGLSDEVERPVVVETPPLKTSDDIRFTCVYDIPWDYVHRCPQFNTPRQ